MMSTLKAVLFINRIGVKEVTKYILLGVDAVLSSFPLRGLRRLKGAQERLLCLSFSFLLK
jgi:hypothetical protein